MDSNSSSPTICQRLINFILHKLSHLTGSTRVPIADGSSRDPTNKPNESETMVEFKHTHIWAQTSKREGPILDPKKDGPILNKGLRSELDRKGLQEMEARGKGPKETVTKKKKEGDDDDDDETIMVHKNHNHEDEVILRPNPHWPLRSVTSNIDQKSYDYIESRKKAMGVDPQKS